MDTTNGLSLGDAMALTGERGNGFGGNGDWLAMIFLFALIFGFGGNGWGGRTAPAEPPVTESGLCNAMNFNDLQNTVGRGFDMVDTRFTNTQNGLANLGYQELQNTMATQATINGVGADLASQISTVASQQAQCCCQTQRAIDGVNYANAMNTAQIEQSVNAGTQKILDAICGNRMQDMQNQINQLQLQASLAGVVRYPTNFAYSAGPSPFCGCGAGNI